MINSKLFSERKKEEEKKGGGGADISIDISMSTFSVHIIISTFSVTFSASGSFWKSLIK